MNSFLDFVDIIASAMLAGAVIYGVAWSIEEYQENLRRNRHD
jgi:hypothetical protein